MKLKRGVDVFEDYNDLVIRINVKDEDERNDWIFIEIRINDNSIEGKLWEGRYLREELFKVLK